MERAWDQVVVREVVVLGSSGSSVGGIFQFLERWGGLQLCEDAVEGCAGAAGDGEEEPDGLAAEEGAHAHARVLWRLRWWEGFGKERVGDGPGWFISVNSLLLAALLHVAYIA